MFRKLAVVVSLAVAGLVLSARPADAGPVSTRNPYRSFNITGVNYGSMQWERTNGRGLRNYGAMRSGGLFFRRR